MRGALLLSGLVLAAGPLGAQEGEALFRECRGCHEVGEGAGNRAGPHLNDLIGRPAGQVEGFRYSPAMEGSGIIWDRATLDGFLADPRGTVPGTRMSYRGMRDADDRAALIDWLADLSDDARPDAAGDHPDLAAVMAIDADAGYGAYLSGECAGCHGPYDGEIPSLDGQSPEALAAALLSYRDGSRTNRVMQMIAERLGDEEIAALAAHFAGLPAGGD